MWALFAYLGGIVAAFSTLGFTFIVPFAKISYQLEAIITIFKVQHDSRTVKEVHLCERLRQLTFCFKSKACDRLLERGEAKLMKQLDIATILDNIASADVLTSNRGREIIDLNDETDISDFPRKISLDSRPSGDETSKKTKGDDIKFTSQNTLEKDSDVVATEMGLNHTKNNLSALNDTKNLVEESVIDIEDMREKIKKNVKQMGGTSKSYRSRTSPNKILRTGE